MPDLPVLNCDVCHSEPSVGTACVPMVPVSVAYGRKCLNANAHPYGLLVANTAMCGGYAETNAAWQAMVNDTLRHLKKDREQFDADVAEAMAEYEEELADGG